MIITNNRKEVVQILRQGETAYIQAFGGSMEPFIFSGAILTLKSFIKYDIEDVVFCKIDGNFIDAHKVIDPTFRTP